jgi:hypothetical protein
MQPVSEIYKYGALSCFMEHTDKATLNGLFVTTQKSLFRDVNSNLLSHGDVGLQHKLRERELLTQGKVA